MVEICRKLSRANIYFESALDNWRKIGVDDTYLDNTCFNLSISIELSLKYLYEYSGIHYPRQYDIKTLLSGLSGLMSNYCYYNELVSESDTITRWYTESRYLDDFVAVIDTVCKVINYTRSLLKFCETFSETETIVSPRMIIQGVLDRNNTNLLVSDIEHLLPPACLVDASIPIKKLNEMVMYIVRTYYDLYKAK